MDRRPYFDGREYKLCIVSRTKVLPICLVFTDSVLVDDLRLQVLVDIFQKRMKALKTVIGQIRGLLNQTGKLEKQYLFVSYDETETRNT
jgi:hypothetical protein